MMSALEVAKGHIYTSIFIMSLCRKLLCNFFLKSHGGNVNEYSDHPSKRLEQEQCKRNPFTVQSHSHPSQARVQELQARPGFGLVLLTGPELPMGGRFQPGWVCVG